MTSFTTAFRARRVAVAAVPLVLLAGCGAAEPAIPPPAAASTPLTSAAAPAPPFDPNAPESNGAGDIPDNQVFVPYTAADGTFSLSVPEGWARTADGAAAVFSDKFNSIRIETSARPQPPDPATAQGTEVPQLQAEVRGFTPGKVSEVPRKAGAAVLITYGATSEPSPVTGKRVVDAVERYLFWKAGQQVVLTLAGPEGADNVDPWRIVTDSLRWLR